jgi:alcohol dehydrogenase
MGFETIAIARGAEKGDFAKRLGAHHYIDSTAGIPVADALRSLGGAGVVLATASNSEAISATVDGLKPRGELQVIGVDPTPLGITPAQLIFEAKTVQGHPAGTAKDVEETMAFSVLHSIRPIIETTPLQDAESAYQKMLTGKVRFRAVVTTD